MIPTDQKENDVHDYAENFAAYGPVDVREGPNGSHMAFRNLFIGPNPLTDHARQVEVGFHTETVAQHYMDGTQRNADRDATRILRDGDFPADAVTMTAIGTKPEEFVASSSGRPVWETATDGEQAAQASTDPRYGVATGLGSVEHLRGTVNTLTAMINRQFVSRSHGPDRPILSFDVGYEPGSVDSRGMIDQHERYVVLMVGAEKVWHIEEARIIDTANGKIKPDAIYLINSLCHCIRCVYESAWNSGLRQGQVNIRHHLGAALGFDMKAVQAISTEDDDVPF